MDTQQIISDLLVLLFPFLLALTYNLYKQYQSKLPLSVQKFVNDNAPLVIRQIEQQFGGSDGAVKKKQALSSLESLLQHAGLPMPNTAILDMAIESAVYLLNQEQAKAVPAA